MGTKVIYEIQLHIISTTNIQKMKFQTYNLKLQQKGKVTRNKSKYVQDIIETIVIFIKICKRRSTLMKIYIIFN